MSPQMPPRRQRQQQWLPFLFGGLAVVLMVVGTVFIINAWTTTGRLPWQPTETPTATATATPTPVPPTATPTPTPTITPTWNPSLTPTPSEPFPYTVQPGDTIFSIADQFGVDPDVLMLWNGLSNQSILYAGRELIIPLPGMEPPTPTPLPPNLKPGDIILYFVRPGDTLQAIADKFLTDVDEIRKANDMDEATPLYIGDLIKVPVYLVATPTPTPRVTPTPTPTATPSPTPSPTPSG